MKQFFNSIIANEALRSRLGRDVINKSFSHAYIIEGVKGSGKHTIATLTAAALNCQRKDELDSPLPCMSCESCRKILQKLSPDVVTIGCDGKATLGIDSIRFLKEDVHTVPNDLDSKIYIIEEADKMTVQAQNAFLLTLEEPPSYVGFILLCEDAGALLETIRSRAPVLRTEPIPRELIDKYIVENDRRAVQMKLSAPSDYAELLMSSGNGIGNALELLEPKNLAPVLATRKLVKDFISIAIEASGNRRALALLSRFSSKREQLSQEINGIYTAIRDLIMIKKSESAPLCFYESREQALDLCEKASISRLMNLLENVMRASERISRNSNVRLTMISLLSESNMI